MAQKVAVAFIHGMGDEDIEFSDGLQAAIKELIPEDRIVMKNVLWADLFQKKQNKLCDFALAQNLNEFRFFNLKQVSLRGFLLSHLADTIAYQIYPIGSPEFRKNYDEVHSRFAEALHALALEAGLNAPLIVVAHSLGSIIASNYLYDLQKNLVTLPPNTAFDVRNPLERGETLANLFTMGCPLTIYNMRFSEPQPEG
jgi:pimeloyl-ACP methyl ester carboxylesterase